VIQRLTASRRRRALAVGGLALIVALAVAATVVAASSNPDADPALSPQPSVTAVSSAAAAHLAVFSRAREASDALPAKLEHVFGSFIPQEGAATDLSRLAGTRYGNEVYVVPAEQGAVCVVTSNVSSLGCVPSGALVTGAVASLTLCSPAIPRDTIEIAGVIPDGVANATAQLDDGSSTPVDVSNGVYLERFRRDGPLPSAIAWTASDGQHSVKTNVPSDTGTMRCASPSDLPPPSQLPVPPDAERVP